MAENKYFGQQTGKIDAKGRVAVPAKFRGNLGEKFYITQGVDGCLFIYDEEGWNVFAQRLSELKGKSNIKATRHFIAYKEDLIPDAQGRVRIPEPLRKRASIEDCALFAGVGSHLEVWNPDIWCEMDDDDISDYSEELIY